MKVPPDPQDIPKSSSSNIFDLPRLKLPEIRLPRRRQDCPAAPICEAVGNLRRGCTGSAPLSLDRDTEKCFAGLILLISRINGMWPEKMIEETEEKRKTIGFVPQSHESSSTELEND